MIRKLKLGCELFFSFYVLLISKKCLMVYTLTEAPSPSNPNNNNNEEDPKWRTLIWGLNTVIQLITLYSPGSLVWYEPVCAASHPGSPLDLLPQPPSQMVVAPGASDAFGGERQFKNQLWVMEREIIKRSVAVEVKWSWDKCRDPQTAQVVTSGSELKIKNL